MLERCLCNTRPETQLGAVDWGPSREELATDSRLRSNRITPAAKVDTLMPWPDFRQLHVPGLTRERIRGLMSLGDLRSRVLLAFFRAEGKSSDVPGVHSVAHPNVAKAVKTASFIRPN
jgi:hypothetical protein